MTTGYQILTIDQQQRLVALVAQLGEKGAEQFLCLGRSTILRAAMGRPVQPGTRALLEQGLDAAAKAAARAAQAAA